MAVFSKDLGVDLGTMYTRIAAGDNVVLEEPTVVAIAVDEQKIVSVGEEAQTMFGRVPESIEVARPMQNGVIADYEITEKLLEYFGYLVFIEFSSFKFTSCKSSYRMNRSPYYEGPGRTVP